MRVAPMVLFIPRIRSPRRVDQPKSSGVSWFGCWVADPLTLLGWPVGLLSFSDL